MTTKRHLIEWSVWQALAFVLAPLEPYGVTFARDGDRVVAWAGSHARYFTVDELISDGDPCAVVATAFGL